MFRVINLLIICLAINACGVKGDPLPPLKVQKQENSVLKSEVDPKKKKKKESQ